MSDDWLIGKLEICYTFLLLATEVYGTDSNLKPLHHLWKKIRSADFNAS